MTPSELKSLLDKRAEKLAFQWVKKDDGSLGHCPDCFQSGHASTHELICELAESLSELKLCINSHERYQLEAHIDAALEKLRAELETK